MFKSTSEREHACSLWRGHCRGVCVYTANASSVLCLSKMSFIILHWKSDRTTGHRNMWNTSGRLPTCFMCVHFGACNLVTVPPHNVAPDSLFKQWLLTQLKHSTVLFFNAVSIINTFPLWFLYNTISLLFLLTLHLDQWKRNVASEAVVYTFLSQCFMPRKKTLPTTDVG